MGSLLSYIDSSSNSALVPKVLVIDAFLYILLVNGKSLSLLLRSKFPWLVLNYPDDFTYFYQLSKIIGILIEIAFYLHRYL